LFLLLRSLLLLVCLTVISLIIIPLLLNEAINYMKSKLNKIIEEYADIANGYVEGSIDLIKRGFPIALGSVLAIWLLMPEYDLQVLLRLVTTFNVLLLMVWAAGRVFWTTRSKDLTSLEQIHRDYMYAGLIAACAIASATASL